MWFCSQRTGAGDIVTGMTQRAAGGRVLRLTEHAEQAAGTYTIAIALEGRGPTLRATSTFTLALTDQDRADLRWYLEDYLQYPLDPAPEIARRIEDRMGAIGEEICRGVFLSNRDATRIWDRAREDLADTRVEVITDVRHAASVPWELLRDPDSHTALALEAQAFVRSHGMATKIPKGAAAIGAGPLRILLVICRPSGGQDVPFRSVARRLLDGLDEAAHDLVQLEVLRPPTFADLSRVLRAARSAGKPYHVVHFDGHGAYLDEHEKTIADVLSGVNVHVLGGGRQGAHGYLLFESSDEATRERGQLVDGPELGALLVETGVPVLVLNACRSAHADLPEKPEDAGGGSAPRDPHSEVASFGSLALEVMDRGVSGVVAMRYNVYVVTAAQFVAELYGALVNGLALGEAVTLGRKQLAAQPQREITFAPLPLQDWCVPVVYEVEPLPLFPAPASSRGIKLVVGKKDAGAERGALVGVPAAPDVGFFGRDETLLALDRAFDRHRVVLLHAYAGSGKSSTAAEFARWYARTGGVEGPVLWTSFERRMTLPQALDMLGRVFEGVLAKNGIQWLALDDEKRREIALQVLKQREVLWVWDNVEPVAGFPAGTASQWSAEEQRELLEFLREVRGTKAKVLLTSRRDEQGWLGELPRRIQVPPMPLVERVHLARALAEKRGARIEQVGDWRPLLAFTQGNPMAITVLVGAALREGIRSKEEVEAFVAKLRAGEAAFPDEESEGRSRSLGASLGYGFEAAFGEEDRRRLALLHLFQGFVDVEVLRAMGTPAVDYCVPELRGLTRDAGIGLLDRGAELGLLTALGNGYYAIHPAVPWFLRGVYEQYHDTPADTKNLRAYVESMSAAGNHHIKAYNDDQPVFLWLARAEEANFLKARRVAREHNLWSAVVGTMQGLRILYEHSGMTAEWSRLVDELIPYLVTPTTQAPLPDLEEPWLMITGYHAAIARRDQDLDHATLLQRARVEVCRRRAADAIAAPGDLSDAQANSIRSLAIALEQLGVVRRKLRAPDCMASFEEALGLLERIGDIKEQVAVIANIGYVHMDAHDLAAAERTLKHGLGLLKDRHLVLRGQLLGVLGQVKFNQGWKILTTGGPEQESVARANESLAYLQEALLLLPPDDFPTRAIIHHTVSVIFGIGGNASENRAHANEAIRCFETAGDRFGAASTRLNFAQNLRALGAWADARAFAETALRNFETYGDRAADEIQKTRTLLADINRLLAARPT